ncbi:MAG: OmpH family outer membrane protein [Acidobacteriota bacterium]|jgi:Skp family chaperone for outer membrane proteins|nr:OmpH family outer membrane protein [Acidobacteriota bacterium]NLT33477.1 OmpH family outer membrane protein [Acidobacteriota bacterium]
MNRSILKILFAALLLPTLGAAQTPAPAAAGAPVKIAWVNMDQAILTCDEGAKMYAEIQQFIEAKNVELDNLRKEAENLRTKLSVQGSKLTDEARMDLEQQAEIKDTDLQRFQQDTQRDINGRRDRMTNTIGKRMMPVVEQVAKAKALDAILLYNPARDLWINDDNPALNVTEDIVKAYNQAYPSSAPKVSAKP